MNVSRKLILLATLLMPAWGANAQLLDNARGGYTEKDSLRGMLTPVRTCYDVTYYNLNIKVDPADETIAGWNEIHYWVVDNFLEMQIDLFSNMKIDSIMHEGVKLEYRRKYNAVFVEMDKTEFAGDLGMIKVYYHGKPLAAKKAPWDGGLVWEEDKNGKPWIGVAVQGTGASLWFPNKDHQSDEPDSATVTAFVPEGLTFVGNGNLVKEWEAVDHFQGFSWHVSYPINNYNITLNIADYVHFSDTYTSITDGSELTLDYYVLPWNLEKAKEHFKQVKPMLACFEQYLGKYPFWEDGFALVETPYAGMEHQSAIAYGNKYMTGYWGHDYSQIGLDFDYIIIHETGHEWWGNAVTAADIADMWIQEGFCTYSEALYVECMYDYETAMKYVNAKADDVANAQPIVGDYGVNNEGDGDMYSKGMLIANTLRHIIQDDDLWFEMLYEMSNDVLKFKPVSTQDMINYMEMKTGMELSPIFEQYLHHGPLPELVYQFDPQKKNTVYLRWSTDVAGFSMPVRIKTKKNKWEWVTVNNEWQTVAVKLKNYEDFAVDTDKTYITTYQSIID